jgi:type II secretory pathway component PulJ
MKTQLKHRNGFTLLEALVYLALFSIMMGGCLVAVYAVIESSGRNEAKIQIQEEANFLFGTFNWVLSGANGIGIGTQANTLTVYKFSSSQNPFVFDISDGVIRLSEGSGLPQGLSSNTIQVVNFHVQDIPASGGLSEGVVISFTLKIKTSQGVGVSQNFETTNYIRQ